MWQKCGLRYYQLRAKSLSEAEYLKLALELKESYPQMKIVANDFARLALYASSIFHGLHLGQEDLLQLTQSEREAMESLCSQNQSFKRHSKSNPFILGLSTHGKKQIQSALQRENKIFWDYIALGPCFAGHSKTQRSPKKERNSKTEKESTFLNHPPPLSAKEFQEAIESFLRIKEEKRTEGKWISEEIVFIGGIRAQNFSQLMQRPGISQLAKSFRILPAAIQAAESKEEIMQLLKKRAV